MLRKISKIGNSQAPLRAVVKADEARARCKKLIKRNSGLFKRLA